jgi:hypothetical protein
MATLTPTNISPNAGNYYIGRGAVYWTPSGGSERHMGNAPSLQIKPAIKNLDHFSSLKGLKIKDRSVPIEANMTAILKLDEFTHDNLALAFMGDEAADPVQIMSEGEINGQIRFVGSNDIGAQVIVILPNVNVTPTGTIDLISADKYGEIELTFDVLQDPAVTTGSSFGTMQWNTGGP